MRTLGMLRKSAADFADHLEKIKRKHPNKTESEQLKLAKKNIKDFDNVQHPPLLSGPDEKLVLMSVCIPEFHVFEGTTNHLCKALNEQWSELESSEDRLYEWRVVPL